MKEELANLVRTPICAASLRQRAREDSNPQPSDPKSRRPDPQIRRNVVFTRCFGRPLSYLIQPDGVEHRTLLPQFLPHPRSSPSATTPPTCSTWNPWPPLG